MMSHDAVEVNRRAVAVQWLGVMPRLVSKSLYSWLRTLSSAARSSETKEIVS